MEKSKYFIYKNINGFSLIELIVVMAGLGILTSLVFSNAIKYLDYAKVDEAKSLLNRAAADCLHDLRRKGTNRLTRKSTQIFSAQRLYNTGYNFRYKHNNKCIH